MADYEELKKNLLGSGKLYEDESFPATEKSLPRFMGEMKLSEVAWKRPKVRQTDKQLDRLTDRLTDRQTDR